MTRKRPHPAARKAPRIGWAGQEKVQKEVAAKSGNFLSCCAAKCCKEAEAGKSQALHNQGNSFHGLLDDSIFAGCRPSQFGRESVGVGLYRMVSIMELPGFRPSRKEFLLACPSEPLLLYSKKWITPNRRGWRSLTQKRDDGQTRPLFNRIQRRRGAFEKGKAAVTSSDLF